ncbi:MAG: TrmB family transcriptional regulator [Candidatus Aminicenantia bacterium]
MKEIIENLENFGFSNYEAKAYIALLRSKPVTGYQLSKISGVPRSRIYETLERLVKKGAVVTLPGEPNKYAPVNSNELLNRLKKGYRSSLDLLKKELSHFKPNQFMESIWNIQGRENILAKAKVMINEAKESIYLTAWAQVIKEIKNELEEASKRGIKVIVISCGEIELNINTHYHHGFEEQICRAGGSSIDLVIDGIEVLVGETLPPDQCQAAWSRNIGLVYITEEYIRHEVYIQKIIKGLGNEHLKEINRAFKEGLKEIPHRLEERILRRR